MSATDENAPPDAEGSVPADATEPEPEPVPEPFTFTVTVLVRARANLVLAPLLDARIRIIPSDPSPSPPPRSRPSPPSAVDVAAVPRAAAAARGGRGRARGAAPRPALKIRYAFPGKPDEPVDEGPFESRDDGAFACDATRTFAFLPATDRPSITTLLNAPLTLTLSRDDDVAIATARVPFDGFLEVRSISRRSPYDPVRVVNADP